MSDFEDILKRTAALKKEYADRKAMAQEALSSDIYNNIYPLTAPNTGGLQGGLGSWIGTASNPIMLEPMTTAQFLILWYNTAVGKYEKLLAQTDEEAIEKAKQMMCNQSCASVEIFELCHRWTRTWEKQP